MEYNSKNTLIPQVAEIAIEYSTTTHSDILKKEDVLNNIEEFLILEKNWDGYGAIPVRLDSAKNAKELIKSLSEELFKHFYDGYPNTHGTISFEWKNKKDEEFFIEIGDSKISYFLTSNGQATIKKDLIEFNPENLETIESLIKKLNADS
jgi:hypothetical protein